MSTPKNIPFNRADLVSFEFDYIAAAIRDGHISGDGLYSRKSTEFIRNLFGVPRVLLTTSCTHALEMCALLLNIKTGDEVIIPSFTFVSTANAFVLRGAKPVFCDVRPDTFNLDESKLESLISENTKAIVVVHYAGVGCNMDAIMDISLRYDIPIVEDNAHGLFGKYRGRWLGTFGCLATQSFHETKNVTCGEGGALLLNDSDYIARAEIIREKGTNRSRFFRGEVDKYSWVDVGSSYLPSDILAAFLYAQLENWQKIQTRRRQIWEYYHDELHDWAGASGVRQPIVPVDCEQAYHMYYLLMPTLKSREHFISHLKANGILAVFHYLPLHASIMGRQYGGMSGDCPVTEDVSDRLLRLPFYYSLSDAEQKRVIDVIKEFSAS